MKHNLSSFFLFEDESKNVKKDLKNSFKTEVSQVYDKLSFSFSEEENSSILVIQMTSENIRMRVRFSYKDGTVTTSVDPNPISGQEGNAPIVISEEFLEMLDKIHKYGSITFKEKMDEYLAE